MNKGLGQVMETVVKCNLQLPLLVTDLFPPLVTPSCGNTSTSALLERFSLMEMHSLAPWGKYLLSLWVFYLSLLASVIVAGPGALSFPDSP